MRLSRALSASPIRRPWREAASLLLVAPTTSADGQQTLSFLTMKRSARSSFMPNGIVFPGGAVSPVDSSPAWRKLFERAGVSTQGTSFLTQSAHRPEIYKKSDDEAETLPKEASLRIAAIRETFEECGIFLTRSLDKSSSVRNSYNPPGLIDKEDISKWQKVVKSDPDEFLALCDNFAVVPDIHRLSEWSNFLTPTVYRSRQRFDTMFYMTMLPEPLPFVIDAEEAESVEWSTATSLVQKHNQGEIRLMPPQLYEMSRLSNIHSVVHIEKLMDLRRHLGVERWLPVIFKTSDGIISALPGDDLYPEDPVIYDDEVPAETLEKTSENLNISTVRHHRFVANSGVNVGVLVNITPRYGQFYSEF